MAPHSVAPLALAGPAGWHPTPRNPFRGARQTQPNKLHGDTASGGSGTSTTPRGCVAVSRKGLPAGGACTGVHSTTEAGESRMALATAPLELEPAGEPGDMTGHEGETGQASFADKFGDLPARPLRKRGSTATARPPMRMAAGWQPPRGNPQPAAREACRCRFSSEIRSRLAAARSAGGAGGPGRNARHADAVQDVGPQPAGAARTPRGRGAADPTEGGAERSSPRAHALTLRGRRDRCIRQWRLLAGG